MGSIKKNNSGFTLLELLITIVIIGIVAGPFLNSFIQAINMNIEAKRLQNATIAAQDMAEEFKSKELDDLITNIYNGNYSSSAASGSTLEVHKFTGIQVEGVDGERFYVDVELDPNAIVLEGDVSFNGGLLPTFSSLYGGNTQMLFTEYIEGDTLKSNTAYEKSCVINIHCKEDKIGSEYSYTYNFILNSTYTNISDSTDTVAYSGDAEKKFSATDMHSAYLMAPLYDDSTSDFVSIGGEQLYCGADKLKIVYEFVPDGADPSGNQPEFTFYIAEQAVKNKASGLGTTVCRFKPENIQIVYGGSTYTLDAGATNVYDNTGKALKINTNIGKIANLSKDGLTYSEDNVARSLYKMTVNVHYGKADGEVLTSFTSTKEE